MWPSISADGRVIVFERGFGIWSLDTESGQAREVNIRRRGASPSPGVERVRQADQFQDLALSPDGKKVAFVARGEVFAASATDGGDAVRVTNTNGIESRPTWTADSRKLVYVSERNGAGQLFLYDFGDERRDAVDERHRGRHVAALLAGRQAARVRARGPRAARARHGVEARARRGDGQSGKAAARFRPAVRVVAGLEVDRVHAGREQAVSQRLRRVGRRGRGRRQGPARELPRQRRQQQRLVESRRHLHPLRHGAAHRVGPARAHRPFAAHAALPRRPVPRAVQGGDAEVGLAFAAPAADADASPGAFARHADHDARDADADADAHADRRRLHPNRRRRPRLRLRRLRRLDRRRAAALRRTSRRKGSRSRSSSKASAVA